MEYEWPLVSLGDVINLKRGYDLAARDREAGYVPIISSSGLTGTHSKAMVNAPGVVTGRYGTIGLVHYVEEPFWPLNTTLYVQDFKGNHPRFVYYLLKTISYRDYLDKAAVPGINRNDVHRAMVYLPPISEQESIAETMLCLDKRIESLEAENETIEEMARAIFKSWFVDFDPVRAKAEGREPVGMDAATAALFPSEFEECGTGEIPAGWKFVPFGNILIQTIGGDWGKDEPDEKHTERVAIIRGTDMPTIRSGFVAGIPSRFTTQKKLESRALADGDIVIEVSGGSPTQPTGRSIFITASTLGRFSTPVVPASFCRLIRPRDLQTGTLLTQHLSHIYAEGKMWGYQNQSTGISNFQTKHFLEVEQVCVPSAGVLAAFHELVRPLLDRQQSEMAQTLADLRDTLLPRLISGKLRVPEAEKLVEAVL